VLPFQFLSSSSVILSQLLTFIPFPVNYIHLEQCYLWQLNLSRKYYCLKILTRTREFEILILHGKDFEEMDAMMTMITIDRSTKRKLAIKGLILLALHFMINLLCLFSMTHSKFLINLVNILLFCLKIIPTLCPLRNHSIYLASH
jgi:hypothetical protein